MKEKIKKIISEITGVSADKFSVEVSANKNFGDYSTNVAMVLKKNPDEIAKKISSDIFKKVEVKNSFINFFVADKYFIDNLKSINKDYGKGKKLKNQKYIIDYTDPNPFKEFHIGHLMSNAIGESISRIFEFSGANVKRVCYQGDVGMHVAKAIWGKINNPNLVWGMAYAFGAEKYESQESTKTEIIELNKKIYNRSDKEINKLYDEGKKESLKYFDEIYKKLDTKFDYFIFESETGPAGKKIVEDGLKKEIFEKGENGAIIFDAQKYNPKLHTRVFINSEGLPTYEAKDLGLAEIKYKKYKYDESFIVTGNEVNDYFKVMLCAMDKINPKLAEKSKHIGHGMLRLPEGKMSSRTGKVITAESLIEKVRELVLQKIKDKEFSGKEKKEIAETVAIGAIKYSILKQSIGSDIIYDFDKSISFEGDSGPYLQYAYTRANSVLRKAKEEKIKPSFKKIPTEITQLEKLISYFPEIILKAEKSLEPHFITLYLTELAGEFNSYYAKNKIVDKQDEFSSYKVALTNAFAIIMKNGMWLLGIKTLEKM
jgi:arginyl-tRNA synthetase